MRWNKWMIGLVVVSLLGLAVIQLNFIRIGLQLERQQFAQRMEKTLIDLRQHLENYNDLSWNLIQLFKNPKAYFVMPKDALLSQTKDKLQNYLRKQLFDNGIDVAVEFAITGPQQKPVYLISDNFSNAEFNFGHFQTGLGSRLESSCDCQLALHLSTNELTPFVLRRLAYLILPSLLCILTIITCLMLLSFALRKQRQLSEVKNDFINNLTHELKTPVFAISLASKTMREKTRDEQSEKYLDFIDRENEKLKEHINKVLELASMESMQYQLQLEHCDVAALIEAVVKANQFKVQSLEGELNYLPNGQLPTLPVDQAHIKNVLQNLIDNALKYSHKPPLVSILTRQTDHHVYIEVRDKGIGIAAEHQKRIFEKFYRVPTGNLHVVKGFGLGLSYVQSIVKAHGGSIEVESVRGEGTKFIISLPK